MPNIFGKIGVYFEHHYKKYLGKKILNGEESYLTKAKTGIKDRVSKVLCTKNRLTNSKVWFINMKKKKLTLPLKNLLFWRGYFVGYKNLSQINII